MNRLGRGLVRLMAAYGHFTIYGFGLTVHVPFESGHERPRVRARGRSVGTAHSYAFAQPSAA